MTKSKQLKNAKEKLSIQFDFLNANRNDEIPDFFCDDKECLLDSIFLKIDKILNVEKNYLQSEQKNLIKK